MLITQYVSRLLRRQLLEPGAGHESRREDFDGVVLFVDIADSTAMTERFAAEGPDGAERLGAILNRYFGQVFDIVDAHGGDTIRIEGDAVMALWRDDGELARSAVRAAHAAVALREGFRDWRPQPDVLLRHRLTLGAGRLTAVSFRSESDRSFFVVTGEPLRVIATKAHAGAPNEIVVTDALLPLLQGAACLQDAHDGSWRLASVGADFTQAPGERQARASEDRAAALAREFLPRIVVDRAEAGHATWLAEFRVLSMGYVHLAGLDSAGPATAERIHAAIGAIHEAIRPLRAVVSDLIVGDKGVIAVIACGLPPFAQENNAARALEAARRIRSGLAAIGVASSIGVSTGRAFCGDVGSQVRREYLITGQVMNYCARLMQAAGDGILSDAETARAASDHFILAEPISIAVKGRTQPLTVYKVEDLHRAPLRTLRPTNALHGREEESRQLLGRLDALDDHGGGLVAISGEPGAGKSCLLAHMGLAAQARGCTVFRTATSAIELMTAYYAWRPIVRELLLRSTDPLVPEPALLRRRLAEALQGDPLEAKAALIDDILPLEFPAKGLAEQITGPARFAGIEDLLVRLTSRVTAARPLVLLIDDLHWIDEPSARLLLGISKRVPRLLVMMASRPLDTESGSHLRSLLESAVPNVRLPRLGRDSIIGIVSELLGARSIPGRLSDFVQQQSEGLPFHAEQLVLSLRDQGVVEVSDGKCRITVSDLSSAIVPGNLRDLIVSRIDRLDSVHQLAAKAASAIGRAFEFDMLRDIYPFQSELPRLDQILKHLVRVGILDPPTAQDGTAYAFRHVIIQEVTYELLAFEQRQLLHRRIAGLIEQLHPGDLRAHYAELADHYERATQFEQAIGYRQQAAMLALERYANYDALKHVDKIERLAAHMRIALSARQKGELALIRADAFHELSQFAEAQKYFKACAALSNIPVPSTRPGVVTSVMAEVARQIAHRLGVTLKSSQASGRDEDKLAAHIFTRFAEHAYFAGDALALVHGTLTSLNRAERVGSVREIVEGYGGLAIGLGTAGLHRLAEFYRDRSVARAEAEGGLHDQGFAHLLAAVYSFQAGKWQTAAKHCSQGAEICQNLGDRFRYQSCRVILAYGELLTGNYASAEEILGAFGDDAQEIDNIPVRAWVLAGRAMLDMVLGRSPTLALTRIVSARDETLHRAERLLCDGVAAAAQLQAGDAEQAQRAASVALDNMIESAPTMGIAVLSVSAVAEVHLALAEGAAAAGASSAALIARAKSACRATNAYAAKTMICRPRALLLRGRLAVLLRQPHKARSYWRRALGEANRLGMPLEQALCHLALASGVSGAQQEHMQLATEIMQRLGAKPWLYDSPVRLVPTPPLAGETMPVS